VENDASEARQSEHPLADTCAIGDHDDGIGPSRKLKPRAKLGVAADFFGLP